MICELLFVIECLDGGQEGLKRYASHEYSPALFESIDQDLSRLTKALLVRDLEYRTHNEMVHSAWIHVHGIRKLMDTKRQFERTKFLNGFGVSS